MDDLDQAPAGEKHERPFWLRSPFWIIQLPLLGMLAMVGFIALVMRSIGKW